MRSQSATSGVNARGTYSDLTQYDQKLKPSPLVPRKQMKEKLRKEADMNEAFMRGFFDELEKQGGVGALLGRGLAAGKGLVGRVAPQGGRLQRAGSWMKGQIAKDPTGSAMNAMQAYGIAKGVGGGVLNRRRQHKAALGGAAPVTAKKKTGLMRGLGFGGAV
jgi:hypothetical protein